MNMIRASMIKLIPEGFLIVAMMSNLQAEAMIIEILVTKEVADSLIQEYSMSQVKMTWKERTTTKLTNRL